MRRSVPRFVAAAVLVFGIISGFTGTVAAQEKTIRVAAAADLQPIMAALAYGFEKKTGVKVSVSLGSSATLAEQIVNGAPFDVFLAADFTFPEKIVAAGLATTAPVQYAKGTLVLYARKDSIAQPLHLEALTDARVTKVAVADQFHAPYGRAAYAALDKLQMMAAVKPKLVTAENVAQTAQFVVSGNAQVGLISRTLAESKALKEVGTYVLVPEVAYPEVLQYSVVMKNAKARADAEAFLQYVTSSEVQGHLAEFGLRPVK